MTDPLDYASPGTSRQLLPNRGIVAIVSACISLAIGLWVSGLFSERGFGVGWDADEINTAAVFESGLALLAFHETRLAINAGDKTTGKIGFGLSMIALATVLYIWQRIEKK